MYQIKVFNQSHFSDFNEAKNAGAVYSTGSTIDATETYSGLKDAEEVVDAVCDCLGSKGDIVSGVETDKGFITLSKLADQLEDV